MWTLASLSPPPGKKVPPGGGGGGGQGLLGSAFVCTVAAQLFTQDNGFLFSVCMLHVHIQGGKYWGLGGFLLQYFPLVNI